MTYTSWPYVAQATTDVEWSRIASQFQDSGVVGVFGDAALKGVDAGAGMVSVVPAGNALVRGYFFRNTSNKNQTHDAASASPRIDTVVLRLDLSQSVAERVRPFILKGTPGTTPAPVALTQTETGIYEIPLYDVLISVGMTTITAGDIVDRRPWIGHHVGSWGSNSLRPAAPYKSQLGFNNTNGWEYYNGTTWVGLFSALSASSLTSGTVPFARLPVGTGSSQVAAGNHSHHAGAIETSISSGTSGGNWDVDGVLNAIKNGTWDMIGPHTHTGEQITTGTIARTIQNASSSNEMGWLKLVNIPTTGNSANVYCSSDSGLLYRVTSSLKYKTDVKPAEIDVNAVLAMEPKTWRDKMSVEYDARDKDVEYIGFIAEDLHDLGLGRFVSYDAEGNPDAIVYDRLVAAVIPALRSLNERLEKLEGKRKGS